MRWPHRIDESDAMPGAAEIFGGPGAKYAGADNGDASPGSEREKNWHGANVAAPARFGQAPARPKAARSPIDFCLF